MKNILALLTALLLAPLATLYAADAPEQQPAGRPYAELVDSRLTNALNQIANSQDALKIIKKNPTFKQDLALLLFSLDRDVEKANQLVLEFCLVNKEKGKRFIDTCDALFRIYLKERTRERLSPAARLAIEDYAWNLLNASSEKFKLKDADKSFWTSLLSSENHFQGTYKRFWMALHVVNRSAKYEPQAQLDGNPISQHVTA